MPVDEIVDWFINNPWVLLGLAVIAVVSFVLTVAFRQQKRLAYAVMAATVIDKIPEIFGKIQVLYDGKAVTGIGVTRFAFWNHGNQVIDGGDLETTDKLRIAPTDGNSILEATVVRSTGEVFGFAIHESNAGAHHVTFNYANSGEGCIIQVLHTQTKRPALEIVGSVKGVRRLERRAAFHAEPEKMSFKILHGSAVKMVLAIMLILFLLSFMLALSISEGGFFGYTMVAATLFFIGMMTYGLWPKVPLKVRRLA